MHLLIFAVLSLAALGLAHVLYIVLSNPDSRCTAQFCPAPPLCHQQTRTLHQRVVCAVGGSPLHPYSNEFHRYVLTRLSHFVEESIKGQLMAPAVLEFVRYKLHHPYEPMVLHFAGDNGVGKTRLAELVSLAYGQRCGDELCSTGDSTLVLSGTGYDGLTTTEFRTLIVRLVTQHAQLHPRNGVVVLNELSSLEPEKVRVLLPLLGRARAFPERPDVPISTQLVIITTDFGREGRTRGKSLSEMRSFIDSEFKDLYSAQSASHVRTLPFLPISLDTAAAIVRVVVREIGCTATPPLRLGIADAAVLWLVERTKATLSVENGRAVAQETKLHVGALVERLLSEKPSDRGGADDREAPDDLARCAEPECTVYMDDEGQVDLTC
ncbi:hypothetical protein N2W54_004786 [Lotmaria passim]